MRAYKRHKNHILFTKRHMHISRIFQQYFTSLTNPKQPFPLDKIILLQALVSVYSHGLIYYMHDRVYKSCCLCWQGVKPSTMCETVYFCLIGKGFCLINLKVDLWSWRKWTLWIKYQHVRCGYSLNLLSPCV